MARKGSVKLTPPTLPKRLILTKATFRQFMLEMVAQLDAGAAGNEEISDVSISKLVSGTLSNPATLIFSGGDVVLKSANFQKDERHFNVPLVSNISKIISASDANFTSADVGRGITGVGLLDGTTIAKVNSATEAELSVLPGAPAVDVLMYMEERPAGAGWALYGDGRMEINVGGIFRGEIQLSAFSIDEEGKVSIGAGDSKMTANPDGSFTWGQQGKVVGVTPNGELFAGGEDYATAVFSVNSAGDLLLRETASSNHTIPAGAIDWDSILPPTFDPPGGAFDTSVDVAILDQTPRVKIYYTTDGSAPDDTKTLYTGTRIHLTADTTIKAIAYIGPFKSTVVSKAFTLSSTVVPNPRANPQGGDFSPLGGTLTVNISDLLAGASIRYTTDGPTTPSDTVGTLISPANGSTPPSANIQLAAGNRTLKMIAFKAGKTNSGVVTETYYITSGGGGIGGGPSGSPGGGRKNIP